MSNFKIRDTVRLKSGGTLMTIAKVNTDSITCSWFNNNKAEYGGFHKDMLIEDNDDIGLDDL